jgi:hypothetical protein
MTARPAYLDCRMRLPREPRVAFPSSASPVAIISWRAVAAASAVAWLLVGGFTVTVWAMNHRQNPATAASPLLSSDLPESNAAVDMTNRSEPMAKSPEPAEANPQPVSFKKAPISPPLLAEEEKSVTRKPELPASELAPGEEGAHLRTYGTQIAFVSSQTEAARKALNERKLLFVLHLSGNFEDKKFT